MTWMTVLGWGLVALLGVMALVTATAMLWSGFDWPGANHLLDLCGMLITLVWWVGGVLALLASLGFIGMALWMLWRAVQPAPVAVTSRFVYSAGSLLIAVFSALLLRKGWAVVMGLMRRGPSPRA